jgi:hypothetical protein
MSVTLNRLLTASASNGNNTNDASTLADLQDLFRCTWALLSLKQKEQLLETAAANKILSKTEGPCDFEAKPLSIPLTEPLADLMSAIHAAGHNITSNWRPAQGPDACAEAAAITPEQQATAVAAGYSLMHDIAFGETAIRWRWTRVREGIEYTEVSVNSFATPEGAWADAITDLEATPA